MDNELCDDDEFPGGVFSERLEDGRAGAFLRISDRGVSARTTAGEEFWLSYADLDLELGGSSGRMVFARTRDRSLTLFSEDRRFLTGLKQAGSGQLLEHVEQLLIQASGRRWHGRAVAVSVVAGVLLLLGGGFLTLWFGTGYAVQHVPFSVDEQIGAAAVPVVLSEFGSEIKAPEATARLEKILSDLAKHSQHPEIRFKVILVDSGQINAVALPGGTVLVFRGLIHEAKTPGQFISVLAHEASHVTQRHHLEGIARAAGTAIAVGLLLGDTSGVIALGTQIATHAASSRYSQSQESEADRTGALLMHDAGLDPHEMIDMFEILPDGDVPAALQWLLTHPASSARAAAIRELVAGLPQREYSPPDLDLDWLKQQLEQAGAAPDKADENGNDKAGGDADAPAANPAPQN